MLKKISEFYRYNYEELSFTLLILLSLIVVCLVIIADTMYDEERERNFYGVPKCKFTLEMTLIDSSIVTTTYILPCTSKLSIKDPDVDSRLVFDYGISEHYGVSSKHIDENNLIRTSVANFKVHKRSVVR